MDKVAMGKKVSFLISHLRQRFLVTDLLKASLEHV
jgi:hypothetical protein